MAENEKAADVAIENDEDKLEEKAEAKEQDHEKMGIAENNVIPLPAEKTDQANNSEELISEPIQEKADLDETHSSVERKLAELHSAELPVENNANGAISDDTESKQSNIGADNPEVFVSKDEVATTSLGDSIADDLKSLMKNGLEDGGVAVGSEVHVTNELNKSSMSSDTLDLIAVLKGDGSDENKTDSVKGDETGEHSDSELIQGVTIEGEGEYQIMDIVDDPEDLELPENTDAVFVPNSSATKSALGNQKTVPKLTPEEERAMAMEQIAALNSRGPPRRRKQDIKPLAVTGSGGLAASIGADWSDDDDAMAAEKNTSSSGVANKTLINSTIKQIKANKNISLHKTDEKPSTSKASMEEKGKRSENKPIVTEVFVLPRLPNAANISVLNKTKPIEIVQKGTKDKALVEDKLSASSLSSPLPSGGKRLIKRKIIWDPDAPETQVSYANLVRSSPAPKEEKGSPAAAKALSIDKQSAAKKIKVSIATKPEKKVEKKVVVQTATVNDQAQSEIEMNGNFKGKIVLVDSKQDQKPSSSASAPSKRRPQTPLANGNVTNVAAAGDSGPGTKKKRVRELDRLMGDEGAVNMLNSLESERSKSQATDQDDDKAHKPHMRRRVNTTSGSETSSKAEQQSPSAVAGEELIGTGASSSGVVPSVTVKAKRNAKSKASDSWDYVYQKQKLNDDSMIIRRRSNSSYSSTASLNRSSLDAPPAAITPSKSESSLDETNESTASAIAKYTNKKALNGPTKDAKTFEFAKPDSKVEKKRNRRSSGANHLVNDVKKASNSRRGNNRSPVGEKAIKGSRAQSPAVASKNDPELVKRKVGNVAHISVNASKSKISYTFSTDLMMQLIITLEKLESDPECNAVVITTNTPHFCQGLDVSGLAEGPLEDRRKQAGELATTTKHYLKTLATFSKPLVAGVNGKVLGLGVMQLVLFDFVIGSDKSTYETPYVKRGQIPEGYCLWNGNMKVRESTKSKLFLLCEPLHAAEAVQSGLIAKSVVVGKVVEESIAVATKLASMSVRPMNTLKFIANSINLDIVLNTLDEEFVTIVKQWLSPECCEHFKKTKDAGHF